ncbi:MAG: leucyl aminopeptidase family protein, partial [Candidatus Competibacterales bacterium]|nr:leucyl aminopeptidase family protein [Candidatus Competibacterales bacterium]
MNDTLLEQIPDDALPLLPVTEADCDRWCAQQPPNWQRWLTSAGFRARAGSHCLLPDLDGAPAAVAVGFDPAERPWQLAGPAATLPAGNYRLEVDWNRDERESAALGWLLGGYRFDRYKSGPLPGARLAPGGDLRLEPVRELARATTLVRNLINTPAEDMLPEHLAAATETLASEFGAGFRQWVGDELLRDNYPLIHAVGRASTQPPRLLELRWGDPDRPGVSLVGKGVCFDSGGLDLKPASGMRLMKKDMGGAAHVLGLARLIMARRLPVHLRVLIPAVENAVAGNAFRPGDVLRSRQGLSVEIENTDAEGRLILADALTAAAEERPELILDFATLTGAARVAVGTEIAAFFSHHEPLSAALTEAGAGCNDPLWRLPLHGPYRALLDSRIADMANASSNGYAGAITAALFLHEFVPADRPWA